MVLVMIVTLASVNLLILILFFHIIDGLLGGRLKKKLQSWFDRKFGE